MASKSWWHSLKVVHSFNNALAWITAIAALLIVPIALLQRTWASATAGLIVGTIGLVAVAFRVQANRLRYAQALPRQLKNGKRTKFVCLLKDVPVGTARIHYEAGDGEARAFADQIVAILEELHWAVSGHEPTSQTRDTPHPTEALVFDIPANGPLPDGLQPLRDALAEIGFSSGTRPLGSADGVIDLFVGSKRPRD